MQRGPQFWDLGRLICLAIAVSPLLANCCSAEDPETTATLGRELFERKWTANDPRSAGGDGLGPLYNETSCAACHKQGSLGGAGPVSQNNHLAIGDVPRSANKATIARLKVKFKEVHPELRLNGSVLIHRFSTSDKYDPWRDEIDQRLIEDRPAETESSPFVLLPGNIALPATRREPFAFAKIDPKSPREVLRRKVASSRVLPRSVSLGDEDHLTVTERNSPALFGAGLLDAIPDIVLLQSAKSVDSRWPTVRGFVAIDSKGRVGRFGWKGDVPTLRDFVARACALELGLNQDDHAQSINPKDIEYRAPGPDLTTEQLHQLTSFVASLPQPLEVEGSDDMETQKIAAGRDRFREVGCAACHRPRLGDVWYAYTDLLLHDMGHSLSSSGSYDGTAVVEDDSESPATGKHPRKRNAKSTAVVATPFQWRTPPLWGLRDSAPYMHDGRADTIEEAIALHSGEAEPSAQAYFNLTDDQRGEIQTFLKTLVAP